MTKPQTTYKTIDTAPKDATDILAYSPHGHGWMVVCWFPDIDHGETFPWTTFEGTTYPPIFTHWMELPDAPI